MIKYKMKKISGKKKLKEEINCYYLKRKWFRIW